MNDILLKNISKAYNGKPVLQDFSLTLPFGKRTCIMGPSGCGKTTLINILCGLLPLDGGQILHAPRTIGMVFQENRLCEDFSALKNACLPSPGKEPQARALLSQMGLADSLDKPVSALSGGMKRRVAIARALLFDAGLLVMDEPFKGLDEETKSTVMDAVKQHTAGKTVLFITHDEEEARQFADILVTMKA